MKYLLFTSILLLVLTGCQEKQNDTQSQEKHDAEVASKERAKVLAEFERQKIEEKKFFSELKENISIEIDKHIDVNKSKKDLAKIQETMQVKMQEISKDIEESIAKTKEHIESNETQVFIKSLKEKMHIQMKKISHDIEVGVEETKVASANIVREHIDLNKTKDLLNVWNKKISTLIEEFDNKIADIQSNTSKGN